MSAPEVRATGFYGVASKLAQKSASPVLFIFVDSLYYHINHHIFCPIHQDESDYWTLNFHTSHFQKSNPYSVFGVTSRPIGPLQAEQSCKERWSEYSEMSEDERCRLSKHAGISIKDRLSCLSGKGKMEKEVLTSWLARLSLPPSASLKR